MGTYAGFEAAHRAVLTANSETLSGNKTLYVDCDDIQVLDPGGSGRDVTLPAAADSGGRIIFIVNAADGAEDLTVKDGATTVITVSQNERGIVWCDGSNWYGLMGAKD